jgi:hypothetical protein
MLEDVQRRARAAGGSMRLAAVSVPALRMLALTRTERAFLQFDTVLDATSLALTAARDPVPHKSTTTDRVLTEQAKGALARIHGISRDDAFTLMRVYSSSHRREVSEVARLVVDDPTAIPDVTDWIRLRY